MNPSLRFRTFRFLFVLVGTMLCSYGAIALPSDKNQSLHISADKQDINVKDGVVIYTGDVKLNQGTLEISAEKLTIRKDKNQTAESVTAEGKPAHYQQQPEDGKAIVHAEAETIVYNLKREQLLLDKNVVIEQNGAVTKGGHVDYDINTQSARATGRVETVIPPQTDKKD